ncbi:PEP-CTERM sorting domain-containing protein [Haloferula sp.]|uniref:PEP-CTERM sorting domain-containing protein n=1 Tax=Haloferula sp. TaxID=2497595 RepID=UPI003C735199
MKKVLLSLSATFIATSAHAVTLAYYDFSTAAVTTVLSGSSSSDLNFGSQWSLGTGNGVSDTTLIGTNGNVAQAVFFNFTVGGLGAGETITIDRFAIDFTGQYYNTGSRYSLTHAVGGNAARVDEFPFTSNQTFDKVPGGGSIAAGDVDPDAITGLVNGDVIQIRFGLRDTVTPDPVEPYSVDNFILEGTIVPIPEPTTSTMLLGGIGFLFSRRRRS